MPDQNPTICRTCGSNSKCNNCRVDPEAVPRTLVCTPCGKCFGYSFLVFTILCAVYFIIVIITNGRADPASPVFTVTFLSLSNYTLNVRLSIYNPNVAASVTYDDVVFSLNSHGRYLVGADVAPFKQVGRNLAFVDLGFLNLDPVLVDGARGRVLNLGITGSGTVLFRKGSYRGKDGKVKVRCDNVAVVVAADGSPGRMFGNGAGGDLLCRVECDNCRLVPKLLDNGYF